MRAAGAASNAGFRQPTKESGSLNHGGFCMIPILYVATLLLCSYGRPSERSYHLVLRGEHSACACSPLICSTYSSVSIGLPTQAPPRLQARLDCHVFPKELVRFERAEKGPTFMGI